MDEKQKKKEKEEEPEAGFSVLCNCTEVCDRQRFAQLNVRKLMG